VNVSDVPESELSLKAVLCIRDMMAFIPTCFAATALTVTMEKSLTSTH
jgi:hypothetical protein